MKANKLNLEEDSTPRGRPRKPGTPKIRKGSIDAVNEAFMEAKAKRELASQTEFEGVRVIPDEPAIQHPDYVSKSQKLVLARAKRNSPVVAKERDVRTGIITETLESGIIQVHVPLGVNSERYNTLIGVELFPDKYDVIEKEETRKKTFKEIRVIGGQEVEVKIEREVDVIARYITRK